MPCEEGHRQIGLKRKQEEDPVLGDIVQWEDYGAFVDDTRDCAVRAFTQVRSTLGRAAERSKQYYDLNVKRSQFNEGQWVWYFNLRKFPRRQIKWRKQYEGPHMVTRLCFPQQWFQN